MYIQYKIVTYQHFVVDCLPLANPEHGIMNCSLGDDGVPSYEDICSYTCDASYELIGNDTRICQSDGSWSGNDVECRNRTGNLRASIYHSYSYICDRACED